MAYKAYFCEINGHLLKNSLLFLYKFYFQKAISLNINLGPFKSPSFSDFADQTEQLWKNCHVDELLGVLPPEWVSLAELLCGTTSSRSTPSKPHSLLLPSLSNKQKMAYKAYFCEICRHSPNNFLLFLYKFYFQRPISHLILIWNPLKSHHSCTLQIKLRNCGRSSPPSKMGLYIIYPLNKKWAYKAD